MKKSESESESESAVDLVQNFSKSQSFLTSRSIMGVAAVDLSRLQGGPAEREAVLLTFLESCASHGFVKIIGHGIPEARLKELFHWVSSVNWDET